MRRLVNCAGGDTAFQQWRDFSFTNSLAVTPGAVCRLAPTLTRLGLSSLRLRRSIELNDSCKPRPQSSLLMVTQEFAPRHAGYPRAYSTREALGNQNLIVVVGTVHAGGLWLNWAKVHSELKICTSAATTWLESPFTGKKALNPNTPPKSEPEK